MPDEHAVLSASSSSRWLHCTPSARLEADVPEKSSPYAEEGTRAHAVAEKRLKHFLFAGNTEGERPDGVDEEMWEATGRYVDTCIEKINEARAASPDARTGVEVRLKFDKWVPKGFGTGDCVLVSDEYIEVIDLKYGKGVPVSAVGNTQMRLYALGALAEYGDYYAARKVRMTIVQPRLDSVSTDEMTTDDLLAWGQHIKPLALLAFRGEGAKAAGEWCRFCKVKNTCRALHDKMLAGVKADMDAADLSPAEISDVLLKAKDIKRWLDGLEEYALGEAMNGKTFPRMKLVEGRSTRHIKDEDEAAATLFANGFDAEDIYKPLQLQTLTALERLTGKKKFNDLLGDLVEKPPGKPTLVAETDKRAAIEPSEELKKAFDDSLI